MGGHLLDGQGRRDDVHLRGRNRMHHQAHTNSRTTLLVPRAELLTLRIIR